MKHNTPENPFVGCGIFCAVIFVLGLLSAIGDFMDAHPIAFLIIAVSIVLVSLALFMIFSGNSSPAYEPPKKSASVIPEEEESSSDRATRLSPCRPTIIHNGPSISEVVGMVGETRTLLAVEAACKMDGRYFKVLKNLYIPTRGGTTEIDVLLLHESGVYVFESKNLSGTVVGDMTHEKWLLYKKAGKPEHIVNPLQQNRGHIRALYGFLKVNKNRLPSYSVVVFGDSAKLKSVPSDTQDEIILSSYYQLHLKIGGILQEHGDCLSQSTIDSMYSRLLCCENVSQEVKDAHVQRITRQFGQIKN